MYVRAFSTLGCAEFSLDEVIALAQRHRVTTVELRAWGGTLDLPAYFAANFRVPAELAARVSGAGMQVAAIDTFRLIEGTTADRSTLLELLPWAEALGVRWLRVFDGGATLNDRALNDATASLQWWQAVRRERGLKVDLMVETHDLLLDAEKIGRFIAAMPNGGVRLLWDAHHTRIKGGEDPLDPWTKIQPHVVHVHVKDSVSLPNERHSYTYVLPGAGEFPLASLREAMVGQFAGPLSLEWEKLWHPYLPPLDEALRMAAERRWW